ncbi:hypothetical protein BJX99DRAFT_226011 [Aspergillus californicus]
MGTGKHVRERRWFRSRRSRVAALALAFVATLAIILPPAILVPLRRDNSDMGPKAKVFVPLYVYPSPGAWDPLLSV